jgi:hypothetical protein
MVYVVETVRVVEDGDIDDIPIEEAREQVKMHKLHFCPMCGYYHEWGKC